MEQKTSYQFQPFKIRTISDQRFLTGWILVSFIVSVLLTGLVAFISYYAAYLPPGTINKIILPSTGFFKNSPDHEDENYIPEIPERPPWSKEAFGTDKLTFIILGYDDVDEYSKRSDTLMVGAVDFKARKVKIVSIPRDTLVHISGHRTPFEKINSAFAYGWTAGYGPERNEEEALRRGSDLVRTTAEEFIGVEFDYVIAVNYEAFIEVVDALGGVAINVERAMHYDDDRGNVHIHISAGEQNFDGEQALNYVRFRDDAAGDLGRIQRQQQLLKALFSQAIKPGNFVKLDDASRAFLDNITVYANTGSSRQPPDVQLRHVVSAIGFLAVLGGNDIIFWKLADPDNDGHNDMVDVTYNGLACLVPDYTKTAAMFAEVFKDGEEIAWKIPTGALISPPLRDTNEINNEEGDQDN